MEARNHTNCVICNSDQLTVLPRYKDHHLVECQNCHFIFSQDIPTREELNTYYNDNYDRTSYFSPITEKRYEELLDSWEPFRKNNTILDVGCGNGFFLEVAKKKGWNVQGIEISSNAGEVCKAKGIEVFEGTIREFEKDVQYDIVVSIEVIEHLSYPHLFAKKISELIRPGGLLYITTPNFNSLLRYRLKERYDVIDYPNHLGYFTHKTLNRLLSDNHFAKKQLITTGYSLTRSRTSAGKSNQEYVSETSDDEMFRYRIEKRWYMRVARDLVNTILNTFKVGDSIKATYIKK